MPSKNALARTQRDDDFNPAIPEEDAAPGTDLEASVNLVPTFAHIPSEQELKTAAHQAFSVALPDALIRTIIEESEEIAHSTRKILQEHMRIGGNFVHILTRVTGHFVATKGDTTHVRNQAKELVYGYLESVFHKSKSSIRVYIRCYEKFANNSGAVEMLTLSDMSLLVNNNVGDDVIEMVIDEKRKDPSMSKRDIQRFVADYRDRLAEREARLETVTSQLNQTGVELDDAKRQITRLNQELVGIRQDRARERENAEHTSVELSRASKQVSALQLEIAEQEQKVEQLTRDLAESVNKRATKEVEVPTVPAMYKTVAEAVRTETANLEAIQERLEVARREEQELKEKANALRGKIDESEAVERKIKALITQFGEFARSYHSAQLVVTAGGSTQRYMPLFEALADLIGKFHGELMAALRAA